MRISRPSIIIVTCLTLLPLVGNSQSQRSISGKVIDEKSNEPIPLASVFLSNSTFGTVCDENGHYVLNNVIPGDYVLIASSLNYAVSQTLVKISNSPIQLDLALEPATTQLREVEVVSRRMDEDALRKLFLRYFLGTTKNAKKCVVENLNALEFDDVDSIVTVYSKQPLQINNNALGYKVYYLMNGCSINKKGNRFTATAFVRFEEMKAKSSVEQRHWERERRRAYRGSITHFMRALKRNKLRQEKFDVTLICGRDTIKMNPYLLFTDSTHSELATPCTLKVEYSGENVELHYSSFSKRLGSEISYLRLLDTRIYVYDNGYYYHPLRLEPSGYMGWSNTLPELLPLEYVPEDKE